MVRRPQKMLSLNPFSRKDGIPVPAGLFTCLHDDLYFPDHLSRAIAGLEQNGADLIWVPVAMALPKQSAGDPDMPCAFELTGIPPSCDYWPGAFCFASSWMFRRSLIARIGPWLPPDQTYLSPSQEWLFRAWRKGQKCASCPISPSWPSHPVMHPRVIASENPPTTICCPAG